MAKTYEEILQKMKNKFTECTGMEADDASDVGIRLKVLAGQLYAMETQTDFIERQCFPETARGEYLDRHASQRNLTRKQPSKAVGNLRFSVSVPAQSNLIIPSGTIAAGSSGVTYETVASVVIKKGETQAAVKAQSCVSGTSGNCAANTVNAIVNPPSGIETVTNPAPFTGGRAEESDEQLRKRLLLAYSDMPNGANVAFYRELAMQEPDIASVCIVPFENGTGSIGMYIRTLTGEKDDEFRISFMDRISDQCPVGTDCFVHFCDDEEQDISAVVEVKRGFDREQVLEECTESITEFVQSLSVGDDLLLADLCDILYHVPGVKNYRITEPEDDVSRGASIQLLPGVITVETPI